MITFKDMIIKLNDRALAIFCRVCAKETNENFPKLYNSLDEELHYKIVACYKYNSNVLLKTNADNLKELESMGVNIQEVLDVCNEARPSGHVQDNESKQTV